MNQKKPYHHHKQPRAAKKPQRIHVTVSEGQVSFRLLCPVPFAGGLIGHSGSVVKSLETETSGRVHVEDALAPDSAERLVYVVGSDSVDKAVRFRNVDEAESGDAFDVSVGQEALLRVYERILEVETSGAQIEGGDDVAGIVRCCRVLAVTDQIGALMGREGKRIDRIRRESGAYVRVLTPEQLPPLANPDDELIQITGDSIAVRKALVAVSKCLQENPPKVTTSSYGAFKQSHPRNESSSTPAPGNLTKLPAVPYPSFTDRDSYLNMEGSIAVEVVFKMLCSSDAAGSVIGKGGSVVKALQEETGASIYFAASVPGCHERVITISALENVEAQQSPTQNAVLRVFAIATEALTKNGLISKWNTGEGVNSRLLIPSNQAGPLIGVRGAVVSDLQRVTSTRIQVLEGNQVPRCASSDERVVQISGDYAHVQNALCVITGKLREKIFSSKGLNVVPTRNSASYPVPNFVPPGRVDDGAISTHSQALGNASSRNGKNTLEHKLQNLNLGQAVDGLHMPHTFAHQNFTGQTGVTGRPEVSSQSLTDEMRVLQYTGQMSGESSAATVTNMTVEVVIPQNIFSSVFDDDGEKLARLKEISGAKIEVQSPSPGNEGKVIISGTPNQTLSGRSILQLYIVSAK